MKIEQCTICGNATGRAGKCEDSIYDDNGNGPFCEECFDKQQPTVPTVLVCVTIKVDTVKRTITELLHLLESVEDDGNDSAMEARLRSLIYELRETIPAPEGWKE